MKSHVVFKQPLFCFCFCLHPRREQILIYAYYISLGVKLCLHLNQTECRTSRIGFAAPSQCTEKIPVLLAIAHFPVGTRSTLLPTSPHFPSECSLRKVLTNGTFLVAPESSRGLPVAYFTTLLVPKNKVDTDYEWRFSPDHTGILIVDRCICETESRRNPVLNLRSLIL